MPEDSSKARQKASLSQTRSVPHIRSYMRRWSICQPAIAKGNQVRRELRVAVAAGFLQGEGCFSIVKKNARFHSPRVSAVQVDREPLDRIVALFGGSLRIRPARGVNHRDVWYWDLSGTVQCLPALAELTPFLSGSKQLQAKALVRFCRSIDSSRAGSRRLTDKELATRETAMRHLQGLKHASL